jgi:hypothetical protein
MIILVLGNQPEWPQLLPIEGPLTGTISYLVYAMLFVFLIGRFGGGREEQFGPRSPLVLSVLSSLVLALVLHDSMGVWSIGLMTALLFLIRQSYTLLAEMSESYLRTVEVLAEAAEGTDSASTGRADRSAVIARRLAVKCGLPAKEVQRAGYAALLCAVAKSSTTSGNGPQPRTGASIVEDMDYFRDVLGVLEVLDGRASMPSEVDVRLAYLVAVAQKIDALGGSHCEVGATMALAAEPVGLSAPSAFREKVGVSAAKLGYQLPEYN